jgi:pilus assembly protein Flp/PilA
MRDERVIAFRNTDRRVGTTRGRFEMYLINRLRALVRDDSGQDLIEYALLAALIALGSVVAITAAGGSVKQIWEAVEAALAGAAAAV